MNGVGWVRGDFLGLDMPAHTDALRDGGPRFLTEAFRATGALAPENAVTAITELEEFRGGSTGSKALLSVAYDGADLPTDLFVKFSRDFDDAGRDRGRTQMEFEVRFALLSRTPGFPIAVPNCLFADYHGQSETGLLITDRIPYGDRGIEPHTTNARTTRCPTPSGTIGPCSVPSAGWRAPTKAVVCPQNSSSTSRLTWSGCRSVNASPTHPTSSSGASTDSPSWRPPSPGCCLPTSAPLSSSPG